MKSIQAEYSEDTGDVTIKRDAEPEDWVAVCMRFNDDVHRLCDVDDIGEYTGLYECFDEDNERYFYLLKEDEKLFSR